jgi:hypothetical protein
MNFFNEFSLDHLLLEHNVGNDRHDEMVMIRDVDSTNEGDWACYNKEG